MEFTNENLVEMKEKKEKYNPKFANWYYALFQETGGEIKRVVDYDKVLLMPEGGVPSYFNRGQRIGSCCDLWVWDKYERNKVLDLQKLNRCRNSRFCPNCKKLNVAKFIHEFKSVVPDLEDYDFYMLTTTVPSVECSGATLKSTIDKLYLTFRKLNHKLSAPLYTDSGKPSKQALQCRLIEIAGGVRVLEVTYNPRVGFHPHLHSILLVRKGSVNPDFLVKQYEGKWSRKRKMYNLKSDVDLQLSKAWSMLWYGIDFRKWDSVEYSAKSTYLKIDGVDTDFKCLELDLTPLDDKGIYEVFKYTFKNSEVKSLRVFKSLVEALHGKRIRQGFGILYNLKCDDDSDGEKQPLELEFAEEEPTQLLSREISELYTVFAEYKKISRFDPADKDGVVSNIVSRLAD